MSKSDNIIFWGITFTLKPTLYNPFDMIKKLKITLLAILFLLPVFTFAQGSASPKVQVGIRAGANFASFKGLQNSDILEERNNTFIMVGAFAQVRILKTFGLRAEILANPKGALVNYYDGQNVKVEAIRKLNYADATVSILYNFKVLKLIGFYAFGGYGYETLTSAKDNIKKPYTAKNTITSNYANNAHSVIAGLGLRAHISNINITPEIRYVHGLTDIAKTNAETKNQVITASLGISLTL